MLNGDGNGNENGRKINWSNREEKSLRHVTMAKFLDDNKPKTALKK